MKPSVSALEYSLTLLEKRDFCIQELRRRLEQRGYPEEEVGEALTRLLEWGYLNDQAYLQRQVEKYLAAGKSRAFIRQRMLLSGLEPEVVEEGLAQFYPPAKERALIKFWWEKLFGDTSLTAPGKKEIIKWARRLYAAGFPMEEIEPYLNQVKES